MCILKRHSLFLYTVILMTFSFSSVQSFQSTELPNQVKLRDTQVSNHLILTFTFADGKWMQATMYKNGVIRIHNNNSTNKFDAFVRHKEGVGIEIEIAKKGITGSSKADRVKNLLFSEGSLSISNPELPFNIQIENVIGISSSISFMYDAGKNCCVTCDGITACGCAVTTACGECCNPSCCSFIEEKPKKGKDPKPKNP